MASQKRKHITGDNNEPKRGKPGVNETGDYVMEIDDSPIGSNNDILQYTSILARIGVTGATTGGLPNQPTTNSTGNYQTGEQNEILDLFNKATENLEAFMDVSPNIKCHFDNKKQCCTGAYSYSKASWMDRYYDDKKFEVFITKAQMEDTQLCISFRRVNLYNDLKFHKGHMVARADYSGKLDCMKATYNFPNFAPMWPNFNTGVWCVKEIQCRKITRQLGHHSIYTGAVFDSNSQKMFYKPAKSKHSKFAFEVPSAYYTVLVVKAPIGKLICMTFFLEHKPISPMDDCNQMLVTQKFLDERGIANPFPDLNDYIEPTIDELEQMGIPYRRYLKLSKVCSRFWNNALPPNLRCSASDHSECSIHTGEGVQFCRGLFGIVLCVKHYKAFQRNDRRSFESYNPSTKYRRPPSNLRCSASDHSECSKHTGEEGVRFIKGPFGIIFCLKHYHAFHDKSMSFESYGSFEKFTRMPLNLRCSASDRTKCSYHTGEVQFCRGSFGIVFCYKHYSAFIFNDRSFERYDPSANCPPSNLRCSASDHSECSHHTGEEGVRFIKGPFGIIFCYKHYNAFQIEGRSFENYRGRS